MAKLSQLMDPDNDSDEDQKTFKIPFREAEPIFAWDLTRLPVPI